MTVRPQTLDTYVGQEHIKGLLRIAIDKAKKSNKQFGHVLAFGPAGTGKTTLSQILAKELGYEFVGLTASKEMTVPLLRSLLLNLDVRGYGSGGQWKPGAKRFLVFIDEISELKPSLWESVLLNAMEDCEIHDEKGTTYWLPDWTLVGATTTPYVLRAPALSRFSWQLHLQTYSVPELVTMITRQYPTMSKDTATEVANRSRGIARLGLSFADSVHDLGLAYFDAAGIDNRGLNELDRSYLQALEASNGKGMSVQSIANVVRELPKTLTTFVEPELLRLGLIEIVPHVGRVLVTQGRGPKGK